MQRQETKILMQPTWTGVKVSKPRFMRMKELPHMRARIVRRKAAEDLFCKIYLPCFKEKEELWQNCK
jgi:hypothetical protein